MGIVPKEMKTSSPYLKAELFKQGTALEVVGFEIITAKDKEYGATEKDWLFTAGKLKEGETIQYKFKTVQADEVDFPPEDKVFESKSAAFFIAFSNLDPNPGDKIWVKREGEGKKTKYVIDFYRQQDKQK